jgi:hypothetical protein
MKRMNSLKILFKHTFNIRKSCSRREEANYEDHLSCLEELQEYACEDLEEPRHPFNTYKDLSEEDWARFVEKCESENFFANNEYMKWLQSQNELDHHLSNTGYAAKQRRWKQEDETLAQLGLQNKYDNFHGRLGPFMHDHSKLTESGDVSYYSQSITNVAQRALWETCEDSNGERENDALSKALQTKEQRGRVHGVSSKLTW